MIFEALYESAKRGELLLVEGGMCRWHLRRDGVLVIHRYDATKRRYTLRVAEVGVDGIEPNVAYRLDDDGRFVKADQ